MATELHEKMSAFRTELKKIMPGYKWTVRKPVFNDSIHIEAIGIKTSGFNRTSTLLVIRRERTAVEYEVKSSNYGLRSPWIATYTDGTLARALRGLQKHYENMWSTYQAAAKHMEEARKAA